MSEKENYHRSVEGDTIIESWMIDGGNNRQDVYKLKTTIAGVAQRTRSYTNENTFASMKMSFYMQARRRTQQKEQP